MWYASLSPGTLLLVSQTLHLAPIPSPHPSKSLYKVQFLQVLFAIWFHLQGFPAAKTGLRETSFIVYPHILPMIVHTYAPGIQWILLNKLVMKEAKKTRYIHSDQLKSTGPRRRALYNILIWVHCVIQRTSDQYDLCLNILLGKLVLQKTFIFNFGDCQGRH